MPQTLEETISVRMIPLLPGQQPAEELPPIVSLTQWSLSEQSISALAGISVNHEPLNDFQSRKRIYEISLPQDAAIPDITGTGENADTSVQVTPPAALPGAALIRVEAPGKLPNEYYVNFTIPQAIGLPAGKIELPVAAVAANHYDQSFVPENTLDGNLEESSRWTGVAGDWIRFDLGEVKRVDGIAIAFMSGNIRKTIYDLAVSEDGESWETLVRTKSTGETLDYEYTDLNRVVARYVRIFGYGNTLSHFTSITEVKLFGSDPED